MSQLEFIYRDNTIIIHVEPEETMEKSIEKFLSKSNESKDNLVFLYGGNKVKEESTFVEQANDIDKTRNKMSIIVVNYKDSEKIINQKKSRNIICPECKQNIRIKIDDQKISLYDCRNGHKKEYKSLEELEKTQYIDESKIICDDCKKQNKNDSYENRFYICCNCKINLCPLCRNKHDKSHDFIDYDIKNFYCDKHYDLYNLYCTDCKKDICTMCEKEHSNHKLITYGSIMPDINTAKDELENMKKAIDETKNEINNIIEKLKNYMKNLDNYYNISNYIIKNHESKKRNFPLLQNINDIIDFMKNFNIKISENNKKNKFGNILKEFFHEEDEIIEKDNIETNEKVENKMKDKEIISNDIEGEKEIINKEKIEEREEKENKKEKEEIEYKEEKIENKDKEEKEETEDKKGIKDNEKFKDKEEKEITKDKEEIKGDDNIEIQKYNFADDKYEDFNISSLKEESIYITDYSIKQIIVLDDQRILIYHKYEDENNKTKYKLCVYNTNNDFTCDICYEVDDLEGIYKMNNGNIIIGESDSIKVIKINQKSIEIIQDIEEKIYKIYKPTDDRIMIQKISDDFVFYCYEEGIIYILEKKTIVNCIYDLCGVGKNEIAIYYYKEGKIYGYNAFLLFYDIKYYTKDKTLKLGDGEYGGRIQLANKNTLLLERNNKIVIIDVNDRIVKKEIKFDYSLDRLIPLNEEKCLIRKNNEIIQYEIYNFNLIEKERYSIENNFVMKYPRNKLIIANDKIASIYISHKN